MTGHDFTIDVSIMASPDGKKRVCVQYPDGYVLMHADDALQLANAIILAATRLDQMGEGDD